MLRFAAAHFLPEIPHLLRRTLLTFGTRLSLALLNFGTVVVTARYLGAAGRGHVSLLVTDCALVLLFIGLVGGSSLVYLAPRRGTWRLAVPAIAWALLVCLAGAAVIWLGRGTAPTYALHVFGLSLGQALFSITTSLLLGRGREQLFNFLNLLTAALLLAGIGGLVVVLGWRDVRAYYLAQYAAYAVGILGASVALARETVLPRHRGLGRRALRRVTRELARHGRAAHLSNILVFGNYRLGYYLLAYFADERAVGVLSVATALTEAVWLLGRSAAQTHYVTLVRSATPAERRQPIGRAALLTGGATTMALGVLIAVPSTWLAAIFGPAFGATRPLLVLLAPGACAVGISMVLSTWYSGTAQYRVNNIATSLGLLVNLPVGLLLVLRLGASGAAVASSVAHLTSLGYLVWRFSRPAPPTAPDQPRGAAP